MTTGRRSRFLPDLPTVSESGVPGFELDGWYGWTLPSGVAPAIVLKIHKAVQQALGSQEIQAKFAEGASETVMSNSPAAFKNVVNREIANWESFGKTSGIQLK